MPRYLLLSVSADGRNKLIDQVDVRISFSLDTNRPIKVFGISSTTPSRVDDNSEQMNTKLPYQTSAPANQDGRLMDQSIITIRVRQLFQSSLLLSHSDRVLHDTPSACTVKVKLASMLIDLGENRKEGLPFK